MRVGSVIFEKPKGYDPQGSNPGYRSLPDEDPIRIFSTGDLATDVHWLSNIDVQKAYRLQLKNTPRILDDKYLRTSTSSILLELGLKDQSYSEQAKIVASIFSNAMELAKKAFGLVDVPAQSLASALTALIGHYQPNISSDIQRAGIMASQGFTECERREPGPDTIFTSVVFPRVQYAQSILAGGLPFSEFTILSNDQMPPASKRLSWICEDDMPMLAKVRITNIHPDFNPLINWGNGAGFLKRQTQEGGNFTTGNSRDWVPSNELKVLAQFASFEVESIAVSEDEPEARYKLPFIDTVDPSHAMLSYSFGLLCENIWCSLLRDKQGVYQRTPLTSWVHATDRMMCLDKAYQLKKRGYAINGYGYGRITLAIHPEQAKQFVQDCYELGLVSHMKLSGPFTGAIPDNPTPAQVLNILFQIGSLNDLQKTDNSFVRKVTK